MTGALVLFVASVVRGYSGFGFSSILMAGLTFVLPAAEIVPVQRPEAEDGPASMSRPDGPSRPWALSVPMPSVDGWSRTGDEVLGVGAEIAVGVLWAVGAIFWL